METKIVCDGVRVDKNIVPAYLTQLLTGQSNFSIESAFYSGVGETCQSGNCGKHITNIYVVKDNTTNQEYRVGSECIKKYHSGLEQLVSYWKTSLDRVKRQAMWQAKRKMWAEERDIKKRASIEAHQKELEFINQYLEVKPSSFLESIQNVIENGWEMSPKQREALDKIMLETDFSKLQEEVQKGAEKFQEVLQLFEVLDKVSFGFYPTEFYVSIRNQFAKNGMISDKQIGVLQKLIHRFRKQIGKM